MLVGKASELLFIYSSSSCLCPPSASVQVASAQTFILTCVHTFRLEMVSHAVLFADVKN